MKPLRKISTVLLALSGLLALNLGAQEFDSATGSSQADLQAALADLAKVRAEIARDKVPLVTEITELEDEVGQKTRELARLRRLRDNRDVGLLRLEDQVKGIDAQNEYVAGLLDEFVRSFETRINLSETQIYAATAEEARLVLENADLSDAERFDKQLAVINVALDRLESLLGGYTFEGKALVPSGDIESGEFAVFGPSVYFKSNESAIAGISYNKLNAAEAAIAEPGIGFADGIIKLINNKEGSLPADPTLGKALKIVEGKDTIGEHLAKGRAVGYVIIGLGLICLLLGLVKIFEIFSFKTPAPEKVQDVLSDIEKGNMTAAKNKAEMIGGVGGAILTKGVEHYDDKRGTIEELLYEKILGARPKLERFLPFMAITAAAAPLLGLLGTVTGMIKTFRLITIFGTGDAKSLSSGISEALVTTELGLIVAIPSLILHGMLSRMARQKLASLEQITVSFINGIVGTRAAKSEEDVA